MKKLLTLSIFLMLLFVPDARADRFIMDGDTVRFWYSSPLKQYRGYAALLSKLSDFKVPPCFDCYSEIYDAEWTVIDDQLYLTNIYNNPNNDKKLKADINNLFSVNNGRVKADWVTQKLWIPIGKPVATIELTSFYKAETCFNIINGKIMDSKRFDYPKNGTPVFINNADSSSYFLYNNVKWKKIMQLVKSGQKVTVTFITGISDKPEEIRIIRPAPQQPWADEIKRLVSTIPWPTAYTHGDIHKQAWTIPLKFTEADRKKYAR
ncbi:MAG: hypothetical protein V4619_03425 [Bacteroidota bacterium]